MKRLITIICLFLICFYFAFAQDTNSVENNKTAMKDEKIIEYIKEIMQEEKISEKIAEKIAKNQEEKKEEEDIKTFEQEVREFFIDPPKSQFGLGFAFGLSNLISSTSPDPLDRLISMSIGLGLSYTHSDINNRFGFRWNFNVGGHLLGVFNLETDFNWIFLKLRFDSSHTRTTHILDFMLGLGLNADLVYFGNEGNTYLVDPFLQLGLSLSFYNHWTFFAVGGSGWSFPFTSNGRFISSSPYIFTKIGVRYNF